MLVLQGKEKLRLVGLALSILLLGGCSLSSPIHRASATGNLQSVKSLVKTGIDVDSYWAGETALSNAVINRHLEIVKYLISAGANLEIRVVYQGRGGFTPLLISTARGEHEIAKFLVGSGANLNAKTDHGNTAFDLAKLKNRNNFVTLLQKAQKDYHTKKVAKMSDAQICRNLLKGPTIREILTGSTFTTGPIFKEIISATIESQEILCGKHISEYDICKSYWTESTNPATRMTLQKEIKRSNIQCKLPTAYGINLLAPPTSQSSPLQREPSRSSSGEYEFAPTPKSIDRLMKSLSPPRSTPPPPLQAPGINRPLNCWRSGRRTTCR
jgi:hypothetical protein